MKKGIAMKNIVICTDGTWNEPDQMDRDRVCPSNVVKIARAIKDSDTQLVYYDKGVGTNKWSLDKVTGGAFGHGLYKNVKQAYLYLVEHYEDGDNIICLGFSRGAYTARSLGGLIGKCGILKRENVGRIKDAYKIYKKGLGGEEFKKESCHDNNEIFFMGVWDTVGAMGIPLRTLNWTTSWRFKFHDVLLGEHIRYAFHAVAIDEKRRPFKPTFWKNNNTEQRKEKYGKHQEVRQRWFCGAHSNIGGGYVDSGLSDITLQWMIDKIDKHSSVVFDEDYLKRILKPDCHGELRDSRTKMYFLSKCTPHIRRPMQDGYIGQKIDGSVNKRWDSKTCYYEPENLKGLLGFKVWR